MSSLYRYLTNLAGPFISLYLLFRKRNGREDKLRFKERLGITSTPRPSGPLVWCHAASVGEAMSVLTLINRMRQHYPAWHILLTTGTVTSAQLLHGRLPENVIHQYVPVDRWPYVTRFWRHWRPDLVLWVESELWPNMLTVIRQHRTPAILLNGRMSDKSYARWRMIQGGIKKIMAAFTLGLAQTGAERNRFAALGLRDVRCIGNLKYAADPLPCDEEELKKLREEIGQRPVWLMASTHTGEDEIALEVHTKLRRCWPDLLTVITPRHPLRGNDIANLIQKKNRSFARRAQTQCITPETEIYLADTMGEMGLFYRLCNICCLAGSFTWGGHNPVEPAQLGCAVLFGPRMDNFMIMADDILSAGAAIQVTDALELSETLTHLLKDKEETQALAECAKKWAMSKQSILDETLKLLDPFFANKCAI